MDEQLKEIKQPLGLYDLFDYLLPGFFFYALSGAEIEDYFLNRLKIKREEVWITDLVKVFLFKEGILKNMNL